jgi:hypothetical protein
LTACWPELADCGNDGISATQIGSDDYLLVEKGNIMKSIAFAVAAFAIVLPSIATLLPKQEVRACSAAEWIWDTLVQDIGCTAP